jgi:hypothetical protein
MTTPPPFRPTLIPAQDYRRVRWRNGLGWTREILRWPDDSADPERWDWRVSIAEVERTAAFSAFPGVDRELVLLRGAGLRLHFEDGETHTLDTPHARLRFAGERALTGEPIDGATHDFNLMWRRDRVEAALWHRPLVGSMLIFAAPGEHWLLHLLAGQASCGEGPMPLRIAAGDTLHIDAGEARRRVALDGGGEALLIRLRRSA